MRLLTQVLDGTYGKPAIGVSVCLEHATGDDWESVAVATTDVDGFIEEFDNGTLERGLYRIVFDCDSYFANLGAVSAFPEIAVTFRVPTEFQRWQVKVVFSPYSYATYFGTAGHQPGDSGQALGRLFCDE
jgi:5-hydroxyisourate hydrolase